jgi:hypothetical protein
MSIYDEYLESLAALGAERFSGEFSGSYAAATRDRLGYERWLFRKLEEAESRGDETGWLETEIQRIATANDEGIMPWGDARELGEAELIIYTDTPNWKDLGWSCEEEERSENAPNPEFGREDEQKPLTDNTIKQWAENGPDLHWVKEERFIAKNDAQAFVDSVRNSFKKGDHSAEIISTCVEKGTEAPYVAVVLKTDGNWGHRKAVATERDLHMDNAISRIEEATTKGELDKVTKIAKRYSRDMQVLNSGKTIDGGIFENNRLSKGRKVGIGFDYKRFATVMNAVASRAEELKITGYKTYKIDEFTSNKEGKDGDILDVGCRQGLFIAEAMNDGSDMLEALWIQQEGAWKPSKRCERFLEKVGPTGYIRRSWEQILFDTETFLLDYKEDSR